MNGIALIIFTLINSPTLVTSCLSIRQSSRFQVSNSVFFLLATCSLFPCSNSTCFILSVYHSIIHLLILLTRISLMFQISFSLFLREMSFKRSLSLLRLSRLTVRDMLSEYFFSAKVPGLGE